LIKKPIPLQEDHELNDFQCGVEALNLYLKQYARQSQKREGTRTYVVLKDNEVIGYYTLVFGAIEWRDAPDSVKKGLGKYPIPVLIIARLAVDQKWSGKGLGGGLLVDALQRALIASEIAGLKAIVVDAKNKEAISFYEKHGFRAFSGKINRLFITITELRREAHF
jgi:GNAT superfamily N-acetyltransferase